jgi:hypothetical protein
MQSDLEIVKNHHIEIKELYFEITLQHKKYLEYYYAHKQNSKEIISYVKESYDIVERYHKKMHKIQKEIIKNLEKKKNELKSSNKNKFESTVFN